MSRPFFITGPESTGKSTLTLWLASQFGAHAIPEYARDYIERLKRPYTYNDVEHIASMQLEQIMAHRDAGLCFFDTGLIITKVWFDKVFERIPDWFMQRIPIEGRGVYLLCEPDLPWVRDPVRENPDIRSELFERYRDEIKGYGFDCHVVSGIGEKRFDVAKAIAEAYL